METNASTAVLDREQLRNVTMDDADLMREIVAALIDDTSRQLGKLGQAIAARDTEACVRTAHYSKGACANAGARLAAGILGDIEFKAHQLDFDGCHESLTTLESALENLRIEARTL
jgi:HPt (histidine-containing phosphotransfer) domain-containing protein